MHLVINAVTLDTLFFGLIRKAIDTPLTNLWKYLLNLDVMFAVLFCVGLRQIDVFQKYNSKIYNEYL